MVDTLQNVCDIGKIYDGADSEEEAVQIGNSDKKVKIFVKDGEVGIFKATYNFKYEENDETEPIGFINNDGTDCISKIINDLDGHNKVIHQYDNKNDARCSLRHNFLNAHSEGIIEFYMRFQYAAYRLSIQFDSTSGPEFDISNDQEIIGKLEAVCAEIYKICDAEEDTWYHISMRFRSDTGSVLPSPDDDLAQGKFRIYVNKTKYGDWNMVNGEDITHFTIITALGPIGYNAYTDAFGFSWDDNYNIGDNLELIRNDSVVEAELIKCSMIEGCNILEPYNLSDREYEGTILKIITTSYEFGKPCYIDSNGFAVLADADEYTTMPVIGMIVGNDLVLLNGIIRNDNWDTLTIGDDIFVSLTTGEITQTAPPGEGDLVQKIGTAIGTKTILFDPDKTYMEMR